uniref:Uncharacterized protein n=1 Tax=Anguilla anguilla TaxID=7936 RepID=A0A0E9SPN6_ANGAN
MGFELWLYL